MKKIKHFIQRLRNNKFTLVLIENFISLSALQLFSLLLPLITLPYILRVIGFENYGIIMFATTLVAYFQSLTDYSFKITATRDISLFRDNKMKLSLIYSKVYYVKILFLILSLLIITIIVFSYKDFRDNYLIFFFTSLTLIGYSLFPDWFFQGIEKMKFISVINISVKILFTLCVFLFIKEEEDFWFYPMLQSLGFIFAGVIAQFIVFTKYNLFFIHISFRKIKSVIIENFPIFVNQFIPTLYNNTSLVLLGLFHTNELVGVFSSIKKIVDISTTLISTVSKVFYPYLIRFKHSFLVYKNILITLTLSLILIIIISKPIVFKYLSLDSNAENVRILVISAFGLIGYSLYDIYGLNYFIARRQDKLVMKNSMYASIIGFFLSFPLVYFFSVVGAALNVTISRLILGCGIYFRFKRS